MSTRPKQQMILDLIGWNLIVVAFLCFLYVVTVQEGVYGETFVPLGMIFGGLVFGIGTHSIVTDAMLSRKEFFDGLIWFLICFSLIVTLHVGVTAGLRHAPFGVSLTLLDLKIYGILIAIAEEICFRGFLLPWWSTMTRGFGPYLAVPISAGAWAIFHFGVYGTDPLALMLVLMVGVILGFVAWFKNRLWILMGAHALVNFIALGGVHIVSTVVPAFLVGILVVLWVLSKKRWG